MPVHTIQWIPIYESKYEIHHVVVAVDPLYRLGFYLLCNRTGD